MKKIYSLIFIAMAAFLVTPMLVSCSDDDDEPEQKTTPTTVDTSAVTALLAECNSILASATTNDYPQSAIDSFQDVVDNVTAALATDLTQTAVDNLLVQLQAALDSFLSQAYGDIETSTLLLCYDFDTEGDQVSTGTLAYTATLETGPEEIYGTATNTPTFADGVGGGKAVFLTNGAHLEIADYAFNSLLGKELTFSVWVNPSEMVDGNYVFSINYWNTFKFNVQSEGKPFCTINVDEICSDCDNETVESIKPNEWTHVVVTVSLTEKLMKFYINGSLTKTWTDSDKPALGGSAWNVYTPSDGKSLPIMIGCSTTYAEAVAEWSEWAEFTETYWEQNVNFNGGIDNLELYSVALTDGQVSSLYNAEK